MNYTNEQQIWFNQIMFEWNSKEINDITKLMAGKVKTVVDIGACVGASAAHYNRILRPEKIVVFEPDVNNFKTLKSILNRYKNIECVNCGIYYGPSEVKVISYMDGNIGGYHVADSMAGLDHGGTVIDVVFKVCPLEDKIDFIPDLIKIDVEGSEYNIIENSTIVKQAKYLFIEWHLKSKSEIEAFIAEHLSNFKIVAVDHRSSVLMERVS